MAVAGDAGLQGKPSRYLSWSLRSGVRRVLLCCLNISLEALLTCETRGRDSQLGGDCVAMPGPKYSSHSLKLIQHCQDFSYYSSD